MPIKNYLIIFALLFLSGCKSKSYFKNEDYKLINLVLNEINDTTYIGLKKDNMYYIADSILLNSKCKLIFNQKIYKSLERRKQIYINSKASCETGKAPYIDSLKTSMPCYLMKIYDSYNYISNDDLKNLDCKKNKKIVSVNKYKILNKNIKVINDLEFNSVNINQTNKYLNKIIIKIEVNGLFYNQDKTIAFLETSVIDNYTSSGKFQNESGNCSVFKKIDGNWQIIGKL